MAGYLTTLLAALAGGSMTLIGVRFTIKSQLRLQRNALELNSLKEFASVALKVRASLIAYQNDRRDAPRKASTLWLDDFIFQSQLTPIFAGNETAMEISKASELCADYQSRIGQEGNKIWPTIETELLGQLERVLEVIRNTAQNQATTRTR